MRRKREREVSGPGEVEARLTPADVQQIEFRLAFRGYNERDVDAFLDKITEDLGAYIEENAALHSRSAPVNHGPVDAREEADRIVAEAREQAATIVRAAEAQAAAAGSRPDARSAIAPFLSRERDFLQSLGSLVQEHAEEIRGMVAALRARSQEPETSRPPRPSEATAPREAEARRIEIPEDEPPASPAAVADAGARPERSLRDLFWGED
jgi:DivIVA domain-containing protein